VKWNSAAASAAGFRTLQVKIDHYRFLAAADYHGFTRFVSASIDLLVRHVRRNVNEIARPGLAAEFQMFSPPHARPSTHDIQDCFEFAVMMWAGFRVGLNHDGAGPEFARTGSSVRNSGCARHSGRLGCVRVQIAGRDDFDTVPLPVHDLHDNGFFRSIAIAMSNRYF
jgi:hypothetical protein